VWWSRLAQPRRRAWTAAEPVRPVGQTRPAGDPDPAALAYFGLVLRGTDAAGDPTEALGPRFVDGRPVGAITVPFPAWCADRLAAQGIRALVLVWSNAAWHGSKAVRAAIRAHNRRAHREDGVRLVPCFLAVRSPWLNPIEPKWVHGKRRIVEPARLLTACEREDRVRAAFACPVSDHLAIPQEVT